MAQLLVRDIPASIVEKLKRRASRHGVSAEEEHRRILRDALAASDKTKPALIEFLLGTQVAPEVELPLERSRAVENRDTGF